MERIEAICVVDEYGQENEEKVLTCLHMCK